MTLRTIEYEWAESTEPEDVERHMAELARAAQAWLMPYGLESARIVRDGSDREAA